MIDNTDLIREDALRAVGRAIQSLGGRFLAGRDVGVPVEQGQWVRSETPFMVDESDEGVGDLNRATALGVEAGARAALEFRLGISHWKGVRVAIQGAGGVGGWLARILADQGAELVLSDPQPASLETLAGSVPFKEVGTDEIYAASDSVFCPCAIGGVLNHATVNKLTARVVAGSANNVLSQPEIGKILYERGVAYAPDYLVNAGALIQGVRFLLRGERESSRAIRAIGAQTRRLLERAAKRGEPPDEILENETEERLNLRRSWRHWCWPS
ncbi:MAG: hypothetical protein GY953_32090, partial [bacterium]|nr:hypothetical protein [bacterium]